MHIDMKHGKFFDNDGTEFDPDLFPIPGLCLVCKKNDAPKEEILCNLTRLDQRDESEFRCDAYERADDNNS